MADNTNPTNDGISSFLPRYYRTDANKKFLQATVEQLTKPGKVKKVNGYLGRRNAKAASGNDIFVSEVTAARQNYQLEPGLVIKDEIGNIDTFKDYQDYINQLGVFGSNTSNHSRINKQEFYAWNPHIDWDKFVNFQQYYWLPYGPNTITIYGQQRAIASTYTVKWESELDSKEFVFTPNGLTRNPTLKLYRGQTYHFEIDSQGEPFSIKTARSTGTIDRYTASAAVDKFAVEKGTVTFTVPDNAPNVLFYVSENDINLGGVFHILDIKENTEINVGTEILGKKTYKLPTGLELSNGMKVRFGGSVIPESYANGEYYVEGVGLEINLVAEKDLELIFPYTDELAVLWDDSKFDSLPFGSATSYAGAVDYITINRASKDKNPWTRYNRWFHQDVVKASAEYNGNVPSLSQSSRAVRPIIEFNANLKLFNFGYEAGPDVDLIDTFTTDVFSTIEGTEGYNIDGVSLVEGHRVLFAADTDQMANSKIYRVHFINVQDSIKEKRVRQIHLVLESEPVLNQVVVVKSGTLHQGTMFWYNGTRWQEAQNKVGLNQAPLFDVVDSNGYSLGDTTVYDGSTFTGTKIFSYKVGTGAVDTNLGFALSYKNINNTGDIVFNFDAISDTFQYKEIETILTGNVSTGYFVRYLGNDLIDYDNGWETSVIDHDYQPAIRIYKNSNLVNNFDLDIFDNKANLADLRVRLYINGIRLDSSKWSIEDGAVYKKIVLATDITLTDVLTIKAFASQPINANGYYEIPVNLQNNPLNNSMADFTLGEVIDHVNSIVENTDAFKGSFPGANNLRDLGNVSKFGTKFVQHSGPASLSLYHITSTSNNIIKALEKSREDYGSFKRNFITVAENLGIDTATKKFVDLILLEINKDKPNTSPYYFSDMIPFSSAKRNDYTVIDYRIKTYPLSSVFNLDSLSNKAVGVYVNDVQILYGIDYTFNSSGFVVINSTLANNDIVTIYEYDNTDGSFVPPTPTKLGIWPKYEPKIFVDTSLVTPRTMIQGHDGSLVLAYGDYRDALILELEKRIFNNIKVEYDPAIYNIHDTLPGYNRNNDYSLEEFNEALAPSFYKWTSFIDRDFTKPLSYDKDNSLTFNYRGHQAPDGRETPGYWRGIYRWLLDTDRPNLCPWEMLGFTTQPTWWESVYGPAPYTSDNKILWSDLSQGIIREPSKPIVRDPKYVRPFLVDSIPVDEYGNIQSPLLSNLASGIITTSAAGDFVFGDVSPIEAAWRRSSYFPFSVLLVSILLTPARTIGLTFDRSRIVRNLTGQLVYKDTNLRVRPVDIAVPNTYSSSSRVATAGLINYITDYILSDNLRSYNQYVYDLNNINFNLSYRIGGFTSKEKFNLLLDSKNPTAVGGVFVPQENYNIILNSSSPVKKITYSGVIITKLQDGYEVKGYSKTQPFFKYYAWVQSGNKINVGGISESFALWTVNERYVVGKIAKYNGQFYRTTITHVSTTDFDPANFQKLGALPINGGRDAQLRKRWDRTDAIVVPYGTKFRTVQEVVDFLQGYGEYLKDQGFIFDDFNNELATVTNWDTSIKEFLFWTTQNWSSGEDKWADWQQNQIVEYGSIVRYNGDYYRALRQVPANDIFDEREYDKLEGLSTVGSSVISLSPAAIKITLKTDYTVVDDILNPFNGYEMFKVDGSKIEPNFLDSYRNSNVVNYTPRGEEGIFGATFFLVQKEQVLILDNSTLFNDTIYNPESGYRQERIKTSSYVSTDWYGGFDIPGFIFDQAKIQIWNAWTDYALGDTVKYKEFYYSAKAGVVGAENFNSDEWYKLSEQPTAKLLPNWTYKASQFEDFFSLDSGNFDVGQQKMAQHYIGYQKRQYLDNIIQDDVSEFKFYQGMIIEKGTQNVLNKLFDVLSSEDKESLTFYEEWAVRVGQYGATAAFEEIEFVLDEAKFKNNPQGFELVQEIDPNTLDFIIRQTPNDVYLKPLGYENNPWPLTTKYSQYLRTPGYVRHEDVALVLDNISAITSYSPSDLTEGDYVWCAFEGREWNIYRFTDSVCKVTNIEYAGTTLTVTLDYQVPYAVGTYIAITQATGATGFFKIVSTTLNKFTATVKLDTPPLAPFTEQNKVGLFYLKTVRANSIDSANAILPSRFKTDEKIWTDTSTTDAWAVWNHTPVYSGKGFNNTTPVDNGAYGRSLAVSPSGYFAVVSTSTNVAIAYDRVPGSVSWLQRQVVFAPFIFKAADLSSQPSGYFGEAFAISSDSQWIAIGSPNVGRASVPAGSNQTDISGTSSGLARQGVVSIYRKDSSNTLVYQYTIVSPTPAANEKFGSKIAFGTNRMFVSTVTGTVYIYEYNSSTDVWEQSATPAITFSNSNFGYDVSVATDNVVAISRPDNGTVLTFAIDSAGTVTLTSTITKNDGTGFGESISLTPDGQYLAVGSKYYDEGSVFDQGEVLIYKNSVLYQTIKSTRPEVAGFFGSKVQFTNAGKTLAIYSANADSYKTTTFNVDGTTTFDNNSMQFIEPDVDSGRVDIYDQYNNNWIYGESLSVDTVAGDQYGAGFSAGNNTILVGAPNADFQTINAGKFFSYTKPYGTYSWTAVQTQKAKPDVSKIKKAFLYNKQSNTLINYIDVVDPIQGKIPGPADQEIKFKTFFDPATYSVGTGDVVVDDGQAWTDAQVGMLWWDLNRAKFLDAYGGDVVYRNSIWNTLFPTASIDIYEWISTSLLPAAWDKLADTEAGLVQGISGTSLYGNNVYSVKQRYDSISQTYKNTYYYWVKNKNTIPDVKGRFMSASDVSNLISNPKGQGYQYLALTASNSFSLVNVQQVLQHADVVLAVQYWTAGQTDQNIHSEWRLISDDPNTSLPASIESKWFDSLCGKDENNREIPDLNLPPKVRYGIQNRPRQSMFVNRFEALKQFVEHTNGILLANQIVNSRDITGLNSYDPEPSLVTGLYDTTVDTDAELRFASVSTVRRASITPVIVDGYITGIEIIDAGNGYVTAPYITVVGAGENAVIKAVINSKGQITGVTVINKGRGYDETTQLILRDYSVLVHSDSQALGRWSIYAYDPINKVWSRSQTQAYDTRKYWSYADWYDTSVNQFTTVDYSVDTVADLSSIKVKINQLVKIRTSGTGGWLLLKKYADSTSIDWTQSYQVVGSQNGTVQLSDNLYKFANTPLGFDGALFDSDTFDNTAVTELRVILNSLKDNILIDTLKQSYLDLFFVCLRYVFTEQNYVDWAFKTSFVRAQHNVGPLKEKVTYNNDNLADYQSYIEEVKPYRTKIREYVSSYSNIDTSQSSVTDFDVLPVRVNSTNDSIVLTNVDGDIQANLPEILQYPWKHWLDNVGFEVTELVLTNKGSGYVTEPVVRFDGGYGTGVTARAFIANGKVNRILLITKGSGYLAAPRVYLDGGITPDGVKATAIAKIGNSVIRSNLIKMKFDRVSQTYFITELSETQTFAGTGSQLQYLLKWGPDVRIGKSRVTVDGVEALRDNYTLSIATSTSRGYTSYYGKLTFISAPSRGSVIEITYIKDWSLLTAADRVQYYYTPTEGQSGKDLAQLMTGVDYGGVIVTGLDFSISSGWDSLPFFSDAWDSIDPTFDDYIIRAGLNSNVFTLPYIPTAGTEINVYHNGTRIDDPHFGTQQQTNKNATMATFVGNGIDSDITLPSVSVTKTVNASAASGSTAITLQSVTNIQLNSLILAPNVIPKGTEVTGVTGIIAVATGTGSITGTTLTMAGLTSDYVGMKVTGAGVAPNTYITSVVTGVPSINEVQTIVVTGTATAAVRFLGVVIPASGYGDSAATTVLKIAAGRETIINGWNTANPTRELENIEIDFTNSGAGSTKLKLTYKNTEGNVPSFTQTVNYGITFAASVTLEEGVAGSISTAQVTVSQTVASTALTYVPIITISNALLSSISDAYEIYFGDEPQYTLGVQTKGSNKIAVTTAFGVTVGAVLTTTVPLLTTSAIPVNTEVTAIDPITNIITISKPLTADMPTNIDLSFGYNKLFFRKSTSDGSIKPLDTDYDTSVVGGDLAYTTAQGLAADDIVIDGDGFVTPTTSPATEEVVPGQITDAVAIKVFYRPTTGSAQIKVDNYIANGITDTFNVTQFPNSKQAVTVKVGNTIIESTEYVFDYAAKTIKLTALPASDTFISIFSFGFNGQNVLDIDFFVGDGVTTEFVTKAPYLEIFSSLVYINGEPVVYETFETDDTYESANKVAIRFIDPPQVGDVINYVIVQSTQQTFATFRTESLAPNGTNRIFSLQNKIGTSVPLANSIIVRVNQQILKPAPTIYFKINRNKLNYVIDQTHMLPYVPDADNFTVYADGTPLSLGVDYSIDLAGITITINKGIYAKYKNTILTVVIASGQEYVCNESTLTFTTAPLETDTVEITSAYQHNVLDIRRTNLNMTPNLVYDADSVEFYDYTGLSSGLIKLDRAVIDDSYVWITKNGNLLTPSVDFKLNSDYQSIQLTTVPESDDKFEIMTYSNNVHRGTVSYMQFKDMLNRTHFKRLPLKKQTKLKKDLNYFDTVIEVEDASTFDIPNPSLNHPGIVEIYGERIEYLVKDGNRLSQLRRGTLGTGTPSLHLAGTEVQDIGPSETIPYQDTISVEQLTANGSNLITIKTVPEKASTTWSFDSNFISSIPSTYGQNNTLEVFVGGYDTGTIWLPSVAYTAGTIVTVGSYLYRALVDHTSSAKFITDTAKWQFFIGNIRLKKHPFKVYNVNVHPESSEGDIQMDPDFAVDGETNTIRLTNDLAYGTTVTVVKKTGRLWTGITFNPTPLTLDSDSLILDSGTTTVDSREADAAINSNRQIVEFLYQEPGVWPGQQTYKIKTIPTSLDNDGGTFDSTNGTFDRG